MEVSTKRFGKVTVDEKQVLRFPEGLIGFPGYRKFVVMELDEGGLLKWLQSLDDESLGFVIIDPRIPFRDYDPAFAKEDLKMLKALNSDELMLLSVVTVPQDVRQMTANLLAPLVVNPLKRLGKQVIATDLRYTTKHLVFLPLRNLMKRTG